MCSLAFSCLKCSSRCMHWGRVFILNRRSTVLTVLWYAAPSLKWFGLKWSRLRSACQCFVLYACSGYSKSQSKLWLSHPFCPVTWFILSGDQHYELCLVISASYMCHHHHCSLYSVICFFAINIILGYLLLYPVTYVITKVYIFIKFIKKINKSTWIYELVLLHSNVITVIIRSNKLCS